MKNLKWIIVAAVAVLALAACSSDDEVREPIVSPFVLNPYAAIPDYILYPNGIQFSAAQNPQRLTLEQLIEERNAFQVMYNDYFYVYMGEWFDMYFVDRRTGHIFPTNPVFMDFSPEQREESFSYYVDGRRRVSEAERALYSQVDLAWSWNEDGRRVELSSFPYAVVGNRREVMWETGTRNHYNVDGELIGNNPILTLTYSFGPNGFPLYHRLTATTFDGYLARLIELVERGEMDEYRKNIFMDSYMRVTPDHEDGWLLQYVGCFYVLNTVSNQTLNELLLIHRLLEIEIQDILEEWSATGGMGGLMGIDFRIPLVYELDSNSILMYIDTAHVWQSEGQLDMATLEIIYINRTFGASLSQDGGYSALAILEHGSTIGGIMEMAMEDMPYSMVFTYINFDAYYHMQFTVRYVFLYDDWATPEGHERFMELYLERTKLGDPESRPYQ